MLPQQVRWACRRGMLELDLMLQSFFEEKYASLLSSSQRLFQQLLACDDPDLYQWLIGLHEPGPTELKAIICQIRAHAHASKA